jgi:hypothetical protein
MKHSSFWGWRAPLLILWVLSTASSFGALYVYDGFDAQTSGKLAGQGGGTGWGGALWHNDSTAATTVDYQTPGLGYSSLQTSGNKAISTGGDTGVFRYLGTHGGSGEVWISMLMQVTSGSGSSYAGLSLFTGDYTERFIIGQSWYRQNFGIERSYGGLAESSVSSSSLAFLLVCLDYNGDVARLWVNPSLSGMPDNNASVSFHIDHFTFDTVRIQSGESITMAIDELRVGGTFFDVAPVPEPANVALAIFAGLAVTVALVKRVAFRSSPAQ